MVGGGQTQPTTSASSLRLQPPLQPSLTSPSRPPACDTSDSRTSRPAPLGLRPLSPYTSPAERAPAPPPRRATPHPPRRPPQHSRLAGRNVGHELHFDLEERALELTLTLTLTPTPTLTLTLTVTLTLTLTRLRPRRRPPLSAVALEGK